MRRKEMAEREKNKIPYIYVRINPTLTEPKYIVPTGLFMDNVIIISTHI